MFKDGERRLRASVLTLLLLGAAPVEGISLPMQTARAGKMAVLSARSLSTDYSKLCQAHFLPMATFQSGLLRGGADAFGQTLHGSAGVGHVLAMAALGGFVSGCGNAMWLRKLEGVYGGGTTSDVVLRKTATDYLCWAPLANSVYLYGLPLLTGKGAVAAMASLEGGFTSVMALEMAIFMPYNLLAFEHVPVSMRPLTSALLSAIFTIGVGMLA